jgi:hypothetical protein
MLRTSILFFICSFFAITASIAAPSEAPAELMYAGKSIDSICFFDMGESDTVDLRKCGAQQSKYIVKGKNAELSQKGFIGYDWQDSTMPSAQGSTYYHFYSAGNGKYWVYTLNNGGGSGDFTDIYLVTRKNADTLTVKNITGGDRCNGGVQNVSAKNNTLSYSVNLTAFDLIELGDQKKAFKAYDDLAACAVCCVAKSVYTVKADTKPQLQTVQLDKVANADELPAQGQYEGCLNKMYFDYVGKNGTDLTIKQLQEFVGKFITDCKV